MKRVYGKGKKKRRISNGKKPQRVKPPAVLLKPKKHGQVRKPLQLDNYELHTGYGTTRLVFIVKDPFWIYAYWEISPDELESLKGILTEEQIHKAKTVLRMYDVTLVDFNGMNANGYFDIDVGNNTTNWYINLWHDNVSYIGEIGLKADNGNFYFLARSNCAHMPRVSCSSRTEQIYMRVEDNKPISAWALMQLNIPHAHGKPQRSNLKKNRKAFYISEQEIRRYYADLNVSLRSIISKRLSRQGFARYGFLLEGETEEDKIRIFSGLPREYFLKKLLLGASEGLALLGSTERFSGETSGFIQYTGGQK